MAKQTKGFLVSTADAALLYKGVLVCTAKANLNTSLEVSMQEQNVNAGKGSKLMFSYKYGRELGVTLEAADYKIEYLALQTGSKIAEELAEVYRIGKCLQLTAGIGVLPEAPVGNVAVELANNSIITVTPQDSIIDLSSYGLADESVYVTYRYSRVTKHITIDAESAPEIYTLVLDADRYDNNVGKIGSLQIEVPSYQPSGNFTMNFTPDGVGSTNIDGKALAVEGEKCSDGSGVYAYIHEFDETEKAITVSEIVATPATINLAVDGTETISVIGMKGELYSPIKVDNEKCTFVSDNASVTVDEQGVVTGVSAGNAKVTVSYDGKTDEVNVIVA